MSMSQPEDILLRLQDLEVTIDVRGGRVAPLRGCSMEVRRGETIGLVGESGSGKTMTALSIMGLLPLWTGYRRIHRLQRQGPH